MNKNALTQFADIPFVSAENLQPPAGLPTNVDTLDQFLLWKGIPQGDLSLLQGTPGTGDLFMGAHCGTGARAE